MTKKEWYEGGKDSHDGIKLLRQNGADISLFLPYTTENYIPKHIADRIEAAILCFNENTKTPPSVANTVSVSPQSHTEKAENDPIASLKAQALQLHRRHAHVLATLHASPTAAERLPLIKEIMEIILPELDDIYTTIRAGGVRLTGAPIADTTSIEYKQGVADGIKTARRIDYLKNRIFKLESKNGIIKNEKNSDKRKEYEKELIDKRKELNDLENGE